MNSNLMFILKIPIAKSFLPLNVKMKFSMDILWLTDSGGKQEGNLKRKREMDRCGMGMERLLFMVYVSIMAIAAHVTGWGQWNPHIKKE